MLADVSISSLHYIEQGAVPRRSEVLQRAEAALDRLENGTTPGGTGAARVREDDRGVQTHP
jgi:hypothetical protein